MPETKQYETRCRFCGKAFHAAPFIPLIGGATVDERRMNMGRVLLSHMGESHLEQMQLLVIVAGFQFQDPILLKEMETFRWMLHQNTSKNYLTDEVLEHQLSGAGMDAEQIASIKELRDLLTETGKYAAIQPVQQQEAPLVV